MACLLIASLLWQHAMHAHSHYTPDPVSLFNHRMAGVFVILLGLFTYMEQTSLGRRPWVKYLWPAPLAILGIYLMLYSDSTAVIPTSLRDWAGHATAWQHKLFATMTLALAGIEFGRRREWLTHRAWPHVLNAIIVAAAIMLFIHNSPKHTGAIHQQHFYMGAWAVGIAGSKIFHDWRRKPAWVGLYLLPLFLIGLGLQLVFYWE